MRRVQAVGRRGRGRQDIDIHLLKHARFRPDPQWALPPAESDGVVHEEDLDPEPAWMSYEYRTAHPVLRWHGAGADGAGADSRPDSGTGSRLFEVNIWMWRYGRAFPRKISVEDAAEMRRKRVQESRRRGAETLKRRRLAGAARQAE